MAFDHCDRVFEWGYQGTHFRSSHWGDRGSLHFFYYRVGLNILHFDSCGKVDR